MVGLEILVSIQSGQRQEFLQTIEMFRSQQMKDDARIGCTIFETVGAPNQFLWVEKWVTQNLLQDYMKTGRFKALLGAMQVLGELNSIELVELKDLKEVAA